MFLLLSVRNIFVDGLCRTLFKLSLKAWHTMVENRAVLSAESSLTMLSASGYGGVILASSLVTFSGDNSSTVYDCETGVSICWCGYLGRRARKRKRKKNVFIWLQFSTTFF